MPIITLDAIADTDSHSSYPGSNYGDETTLYIGETGTGAILKSFINFDLSSIANGFVIHSAQLQLVKYAAEYGYNTTVDLRASLAAAAWAESTLTHNNAPAAQSSPYTDLSVSGNSYAVIAWDVTEHIRAVKQYLSLPWYGFRLEQPTTPSNTRKGFRSREYATVGERPKLIINYSELPGKGATPALNPANAPESTIGISWSASQYASAYYVDYRINGGGWNRLTATPNLSASMDITGIVRGAFIEISVIPYNAYGEGQRSDPAGATRNRPPFGQKLPPQVNVSLIEPGTIIRISFLWEGDPDDNLAGYETAMQNGAGVWYNNGQIMGTTQALNQEYIDVPTTGWSRGGYWKFFVRGFDTYGVRGDWSFFTGFVRINSIPPMPAYISVIPSPFEVSLTVSWPGVSDPDGNFDHYELQRRISNNGVDWDAWGLFAWQAETTKPDTPPIADNGLVQYRVRAVDALGAASDWQTSAQIRRDDGSGGKVKQSDGSWAKLDIWANGAKQETYLRTASGTWVQAEK